MHLLKFSMMSEIETRLIWMLISNISGFFIAVGLGRINWRKRKKKTQTKTEEFCPKSKINSIKKELEILEKNLQD
ncbi:MAG: hypothetical protein ABI851_03150 [Saprospiraceae bacterium]